jgi:hypothetical protein
MAALAIRAIGDRERQRRAYAHFNARSFESGCVADFVAMRRMGDLEAIGGSHARRTKTISIKLGDSLQGNAEGPLGIGAFLVIAMLVAVIFCQRNPPS